MSAAPTTYAWIPELDPILHTNVRYRFAVIAPASWTEDMTLQWLASAGFQVAGISVPPPAVQQAIQAVQTVVGAAPSAWWVIATWLGTNGAGFPGGNARITLLESYALADPTIPSDPTPDPTPLPPPPKTSTGSLVETMGWMVVGLGAVAGALWLAKQGSGSPHAYANPLSEWQTLKLKLQGHPVEIKVRGEGSTWYAHALYQSRGKKKKYATEGSSKDQVVHGAIAAVNQDLARF